MAEECGAKTRSGEACTNPAMPNGRCRMHGGASTGPKENAARPGNTNALKHGFYSDALTDDEYEIYIRAEPGSLDDEIRLMRVKLHRLVKLSANSDVAELIDSAIEVAQKMDTHPELGAFEKREIKVKVPRYAELIILALGELRKLEMARSQLRLQKAKLPEDPDDPDDIETTTTVVIRPDEPIPQNPIV